MITHRYIYPMKIVSVTLTETDRQIKTDLGQGVIVTFSIPIADADVKSMKLVLEVSEDAKS